MNAAALPIERDDGDELVRRFAEAIRALPAEDQYDPEPEHLFTPGMYCRVLRMKAGACIVSKIHKTEHICVALTGRALVRIGESVEEVIAPRIMLTKPGTQRALVILETSVWATFHPTTETDIAKLEQCLIAKTPDDPDLRRLLQASEGTK